MRAEVKTELKQVEIIGFLSQPFLYHFCFTVKEDQQVPPLKLICVIVQCKCNNQICPGDIFKWDGQLEPPQSIPLILHTYVNRSVNFSQNDIL